MIASYAIGVIAIVLVSLVWVGIQNAWRRTFPGVFSDPDVLAGRTGCQVCDQEGRCRPRLSGGAGPDGGPGDSLPGESHD